MKALSSFNYTNIVIETSFFEYELHVDQNERDNETFEKYIF